MLTFNCALTRLWTSRKSAMLVRCLGMLTVGENDTVRDWVRERIRCSWKVLWVALGHGVPPRSLPYVKALLFYLPRTWPAIPRICLSFTPTNRFWFKSLLKTCVNTGHSENWDITGSCYVHCSVETISLPTKNIYWRLIRPNCQIFKYEDLLILSGLYHCKLNMLLWTIWKQWKFISDSIANITFWLLIIPYSVQVFLNLFWLISVTFFVAT